MRKAGILFLCGGLLLGFGSFTFAAEPLKIAYVDMQKALNYCEAGKEAKRQIASEVGRLQKEFNDMQKELEKIKEDLEKRGSVLSENARQQKERDYQTKLRDLQRLQRDSQEDLRRKDREYSDRILKNLEAIIKKIGEEGKYTLILERNQPTIIYISNLLDLTDEVIRRSDKKKK